jgi:hypothetical protein
MQYMGPTFRRPRTRPELLYPADVLVENTLRVWAKSRWRTEVELTRDFLDEGFSHLPPGSPVMYYVNESREGVALKLLTVTFANRFDAYALLGEVFWCGCESIFFTTYNVFTDCDAIFFSGKPMHCLPYYK